MNIPDKILPGELNPLITNQALPSALPAVLPALLRISSQAAPADRCKYLSTGWQIPEMTKCSAGSISPLCPFGCRRGHVSLCCQKSQLLLDWCLLLASYLYLISYICGLQKAFLYSYTWGILQMVQDLKSCRLQLKYNNSLLMEKKKKKSTRAVCSGFPACSLACCQRVWDSLRLRYVFAGSGFQFWDSSGSLGLENFLFLQGRSVVPAKREAQYSPWTLHSCLVSCPFL